MARPHRTDVGLPRNAGGHDVTLVCVGGVSAKTETETETETETALLVGRRESSSSRMASVLFFRYACSPVSPSPLVSLLKRSGHRCGCFFSTSRVRRRAEQYEINESATYNYTRFRVLQTFAVLAARPSARRPGWPAGVPSIFPVLPPTSLHASLVSVATGRQWNV